MTTPWDRFWAKIDVGVSGLACWEWTAYVGPGGYGRFKLDGRMTAAHRLAYELLVGPIPKGLHLDHLCRNRVCVNPDHLEPVTPAVNSQRIESHPNRLKTHCPAGHEYDEENTYHYRGTRTCKACRARRWREHHPRPDALSGAM